MTPLPATAEDIAIWGRGLRSFKEATGTGYPFPDGQIAGHLHAEIPLTLVRLVTFWEAVGASKTDPKSAWHQFHEFSRYGLVMRAQRHKVGWFGKSPWYCEFSCTLGDQLEVRGLYLTSSAELVGLFDHAEMLMRGDRPLRAPDPR